MVRHKTTGATQDSCLDAIAAACTEVVLVFKAVFDPYRPERHYMRGPGPKWRAKHSATCADWAG
jgi:hypothetical protein